MFNLMSNAGESTLSPFQAIDIPETQILIFKEISNFETLKKLRLVSKMYEECVKATIVHRYLLSSATKLHFVMINSDNYNLSIDSNLNFIGDYASAISVFNIHHFKFNKRLRDVFIYLAEYLPNLEKLSLNKCNIKIPLLGITHFKCLKNLQFVANKNTTPFDLSFIPKIPRLTTLNLYASNYVPESLAKLTSKKFSLTWSSGTTYEGPFCEGLAHGKGKCIYRDGDKYEGDFVAGIRQGKGTRIRSNGDKYEGDFVAGRSEGKGTLIFSNGAKYVGDFFNNIFHGKGILLFSIGDKYEGEFENGLRHGKGKCIYRDGTIYEGNFVNGVFVG